LIIQLKDQKEEKYSNHLIDYFLQRGRQIKDQWYFWAKSISLLDSFTLWVTPLISMQ